MLVQILDATGTQQQVIIPAQEAAVDRSGQIASTGVSQILAAANVLRSGFRMQNKSSVNPMYVDDLGAASSTGNQSFTVLPGAFFPPESYPVTTNAINVLGTAGDIFAAREW